MNTNHEDAGSSPARISKCEGNIMDKIFDDWFEKNFPKENFGYLSGAFRQAVKTDIAKKAFDFGVQTGLQMDTKRISIVPMNKNV